MPRRKKDRKIKDEALARECSRIAKLNGKDFDNAVERFGRKQ